MNEPVMFIDDIRLDEATHEAIRDKYVNKSESSISDYLSTFEHLVRGAEHSKGIAKLTVMEEAMYYANLPVRREEIEAVNKRIERNKSNRKFFGTAMEFRIHLACNDLDCNGIINVEDLKR